MDAMKDDDFLAEVRKKFEKAQDAEGDNRDRWKDDVEFAKLGKQWPDGVEKQRMDDGRPCLVINRMPAFIRQVVNQARDNRPSMEVIPADSKADPQTAEIMSGLIRNIEVSSDADIAYDTAIEAAVAGGFGYFRLNVAFASDDTFDKDIVVERISDPLTVYGDPEATSVDGSDWNCAFIVSRLTKDEFEAKYGDAEPVDWDDLEAIGAPWCDGEHVLIAEYWRREEVEHEIVALADPMGSTITVSVEKLEESPEDYEGYSPVGEPRSVKTHKVTQYIVSGAEVLETVEWPGKYIPIIPVYGDETIIEGERTFKSLIHDAKDAQREHNYWRSMAAETIALAPKVPFIGPKGAFDSDVSKWSTANDASHAFIEYDGPVGPQRQGYAGPSAGELQQAIAAIDDMKAIIGIYDASLGQRSNETSGVAIRQRQRQGDVATFHFLDNLNRSIRHAGRVTIDLIAKVYSVSRVVRTLGQDMKPQNVQIGPQAEHGQMMQQAQMQGNPISRIYDLSLGKYDLVVKSGPSFGTQREEARAELVEIIKTLPASAPILGPMYLRNSDWPGADDAADKMEQQAQGGPDPKQVQQQMGQMQGALQQLQQKAAELEAQNRELKAEHDLKAFELQIKKQEADTKAFEVQAKAQTDMIQASQPRPMPQQSSNPYAQ
jgi:hypothetical protein